MMENGKLLMGMEHRIDILFGIALLILYVVKLVTMLITFTETKLQQWMLSKRLFSDDAKAF